MTTDPAAPGRQQNGQQTDMTSASPTAPVKDRATSLKATRKAKMDEFFEGKKFVVVKEVHLTKGQLFQTPFGNKGRHGYVLQDVTNGPTGGKKFTFGATMVKQIAELYGAVELPTPAPKTKPELVSETALVESPEVEQEAPAAPAAVFSEG